MRALSKSLGVTENTVRNRVKRLSKFVSGWSLMMNPGVTGEKQAIVSLDVPQDVNKTDVLGQLALVDDMLVIQSYHGPHLETVFYHPAQESLGRRVDLVMRIAECKDAKFSDMPIPTPRASPSRTDLQIIASRQRDMSKSNEAIAKELGVSTRTVERRFSRLLRERTVWPLAQLTPDGLDDCIYAVLEVSCLPESRAKTEAEILSIADAALFFNGHLETFSGFHLLVSALSTAKGILERVRLLKGVSSARIDFVEGRLELYDTLKRKVDRQLEQGLSRMMK